MRKERAISNGGPDLPESGGSNRWPILTGIGKKEIDRPLLEQWLRLDYIRKHRNLILIGANGLGKTMIIKNLAHVSLQAGQTVVFRTAAEVISDLTCESPRQRRQKLRRYAGIDLLCIDESGMRSFQMRPASERCSTGVRIKRTSR